MIVLRMPLPGPTTVVVVNRTRSIMIDVRLTRDEACLAIAGVLPDVHPDVVDHWLDTTFERRRLPFTSRTLGALALAAVTVLAAPASMQAHHAGRAYRRAAVTVATADAQTT